MGIACWPSATVLFSAMRSLKAMKLDLRSITPEVCGATASCFGQLTPKATEARVFTQRCDTLQMLFAQASHLRQPSRTISAPSQLWKLLTAVLQKTG